MNRFVIPTGLALLTLLGMFPSAFATHSRPFDGRVSGTFTIGTGEASNTATITGTGHEEHLGKTSFTATSTMTGASECGGFTATEQTTVIAANGDKLYETANDTFCPTSTPGTFPGTFHLISTTTIIGGTGRFAHATGLATADVTVVQTSPQAAPSKAASKEQ